MVPGLVGCSKKKEASTGAVAAWFKAAEANVAKAKSTTTTTTTPPALVTTTIPATTSTMPPLVRLALSKAFLEAAEARRQADQRCQSLGKRSC